MLTVEVRKVNLTKPSDIYIYIRERERAITVAVAYRGGFGGSKPHRNSEVLTKLSQIPSSVENTSVTT